MLKDIKKLNFAFLLSQFTILCLITLVYAIFTVFYHTASKQEEIKVNLNRTAVLLSESLSNNSAENFHPYSQDGLIVYVIDSAKKNPVVNIPSTDPNHARFWMPYASKIIYEITKIKRGWIKYPEKRMWQLNKPTRIIRYMPVNNSTLIVVVESELASSFETLIDVLTLKNFIGFIISLLIGFFFIATLSEKNLILMESIFSEKNNKEKNPVEQREEPRIESLPLNDLEEKEEPPESAKKNTKEKSENIAIESKKEEIAAAEEKDVIHIPMIKPLDIPETLLSDIHKKVDQETSEKPKNLSIYDKALEKKQKEEKNLLGNDASTIIGQAFPINVVPSKEDPKEPSIRKPEDTRKEIEQIKINIPKDQSSQFSKMLKEMQKKDK